MTVIQFLMALPVALLGVVLFHDFMAGLGEERLWGEPFTDDAPIPSRPDRPEAAGPANAEAAIVAPVLKKAG
ncbi:MAG: hypothetical protein WD178_00795 [Actinomycetota bacterium]